MHLKRLVVAAIFLPLFYLFVMELPTLYFAGLVGAVSVAGQLEFCAMYNLRKSMRYIAAALGVLLIFLAYKPLIHPLDFFSFSIMLVGTARLFMKPLAASLNDISGIVVSLAYIPLLLSYQIYLREKGPEWILILYGCIWASDSFAYYIGTYLGRRKLHREVSPNKTFEGAAGSVLGGVIGAFILMSLLKSPVNLMHTLMIGLIIGSISIIGDLVESMFKRQAGVKDSSNIVPGHGGILDKIDSGLFSGPFCYWSLKLMGVI